MALYPAEPKNCEKYVVIKSANLFPTVFVIFKMADFEYHEYPGNELGKVLEYYASRERHARTMH